ncbi:KAP family NTPase [Actinocorallia sp. API 0066]|uniref:KAP family P-loop NTPase fold protein n=1 Tax=Actinocorallia sp. API 0066 TaxID=2896846 RepID=UPI001E3A1498|nr:P-loop NTPase fold protein [Actinocorallia sp. API 0066]MCD0450473.1 KAP family NTPase [Actinocorallia sp. API 0066]
MLLVIAMELSVTIPGPQAGFAVPLFDDNPSVDDLLGFDTVAEVVARVVSAGGLDPVTVGIHSAWGGGKSTALNLVANRLGRIGSVVVVRIDPWEFENAEDLRGTLIAQVLDELQSRVASAEMEPSKRRQLVNRLGDLRRRIAWGRVAGVLVSSAVTLSPNFAELLDALTPQPKEEESDAGTASSQGMAGFRLAFEQLMGEVDGIEKVVVLVDDLDRCLPPTIMATLEAIKLFLSVRRMAFVLAADEDLIREAIGVHLEGASRGGFAKLYTEKIIQLPISLPVLSVEQAEAYITLLLCKNAGHLTTQAFQDVVNAANERRLQGKAPYVAAGENESDGPRVEHLVMAARIAAGLGADVWRSPRAIKRFLNAFAVREHLTRTSGAQLELEVLLKLYLLEIRYLEEFRLLSQQSSAERTALIADWERWASDDGDQPQDVREETKAWAASHPSLAGLEAQVERYLSIAATLLSDVRFGGAVTGALMRIIEGLADASEATRNAAAQELKELESADRQVVVQSLGIQLSRLADPEPVIWSLSTVSQADPDLADTASRVLSQPTFFRRLEPHHVVLLGVLPDVLRAIIGTEGLDPDVVEAARAELTEPPR